MRLLYAISDEGRIAWDSGWGGNVGFIDSRGSVKGPSAAKLQGGLVLKVMEERA